MYAEEKYWSPQEKSKHIFLEFRHTLFNELAHKHRRSLYRLHGIDIWCVEYHVFGQEWSDNCDESVLQYNDRSESVAADA